MSGIQDHQVPSPVCDDERYDREPQNGRHVPIFEEKVYKIITALEDATSNLDVNSVFLQLPILVSHRMQLLKK
jgi:hypothetical protein